MLYEVITRYQAAYGSVPADYAALTWDSIGLLMQGIQNAGKVVTDPVELRKLIRDGLASIV